MNVTLISSTGGHWTQLQNIHKEFIERNDKYVKLKVITEKNTTNSNAKNINFLLQQDRKNKFFLLIFIWNVLKSLYYVLSFRPNIVITTGAGMTLPYLLFSKFIGAKIVFIESYAKINSPTLTGRLAYKFADYFYVQWPEMLEHYPKAKYKGSLY